MHHFQILSGALSGAFEYMAETTFLINKNNLLIINCAYFYVFESGALFFKQN